MVRIKYRYLLFNILYPESNDRTSSLTPDYLRFHGPTARHVTAQLFLGHLRSHITLLFGDHGLGVSMSSLKLIYFSNATSTAILRVPRNHYNLAWAALTYMNELPPPFKSHNTRPLRCTIRVVRVSGTIRKAEEELLKRSRIQIVRAKLEGQGQNSAALERLVGGSQSAAAPVQDHMPISAEDPEIVEEDDSDIEDDGVEHEQKTRKR